MIKANVVIIDSELDADHPIFQVEDETLKAAGFSECDYDGIFAHEAKEDGSYVIVDGGENFWVASGTLDEVMARIKDKETS